MTSNTLRFGEDATIPWNVVMPRKPPKEVKNPTIRGRETHGFTNKELELALSERKTNYEPFIIQKERVQDKRKTCQKKIPLEQEVPAFPQMGQENSLKYPMK